MPRERHTPQAQSARPAPDALHARAPSPSRSFPYNAPDDPSSTGQRRPTLPSFVYRQEVFELSIYVASSIAHAHEESNRGLAISHKHTTWAKVDFHDAWRHSATDSFQMNDLALRAATLSAKPSEGAEMPENAATDATPAESQVVIPEVLPMEGETTFAKKAKGIAQVAAGSALTAAPGPGVAAIVGGAALVSRGNRNYTGRTATPLEERLDEAASKAADLAVDTAMRTAGKAGEKAKDAAVKTGAIAREAAEMAATSAPEVAKGFTRGATTAAHVASAAAKNVVREAKPLFASAKRAVGSAISSAKRAEQGAAKRSR